VVRRCAVLGSPIAHSLSPALHTAAYEYLGLTGWTYGRHEVNEAGLRPFLDALDGTWRGLSLTMPLKHVALQCVDDASDLARGVLAANTILLDSGRRYADNTDVPGMANALRERGVEPVHEAAVLGGGATARSALASLGELAERVVVYLRTTSRAVELQRTATMLRVAVDFRPWDERAQALAAPLVISTAPAGAVDDLSSVVPPNPGVLFDVIYAPWPTALAAGWLDRGGTVLSGLDLLIHQARLQMQAMTGRDVPIEVLRKAGEAAL
jgi:shikimate dehydrogenase